MCYCHLHAGGPTPHLIQPGATRDTWATHLPPDTAYCHVLQPTDTCYILLPCGTAYCHVLQPTDACYSLLTCATAYCHVLQSTDTCYKLLPPHKRHSPGHTCHPGYSLPATAATATAYPLLPQSTHYCRNLPATAAACCSLPATATA